MCQEGREKIAKNVKNMRIKLGYTKEMLSLKINKDNSYISKLENKKINIPIDVIEKIARELKIEITDLFL